MAEFINFQADVDTTDSEFEEEVNDDRDEVTSVSKTADEAINDFLINDETVSDEISNYCQESSDDEDKIDNFVSSKNKIDTLKKRFLTLKILQNTRYFMQVVMP